MIFLLAMNHLLIVFRVHNAKTCNILHEDVAVCQNERRCSRKIFGDPGTLPMPS